jgi:hypothetical protein
MTLREELVALLREQRIDPTEARAARIEEIQAELAAPVEAPADPARAAAIPADPEAFRTEFAAIALQLAELPTAELEQEHREMEKALRLALVQAAEAEDLELFRTLEGMLPKARRRILPRKESKAERDADDRRIAAYVTGHYPH